MPKVRIIHEDKDTTLSLSVTMAQGKQVVSVAAGADYEFDLPSGSTVDIAVQKTEHPNATMLQRIGDMLHFRHDTAAGKLNAGKQPSPALAEVETAMGNVTNAPAYAPPASESVASPSATELTEDSTQAVASAGAASTEPGAEKVSE